AAKDASERERSHAADTNSEQGEAQALTGDELENLARLSAEGDANAHFVNALRDRVRHHAVNSDRRKQQRENCEKAKQPGAETRLRNGRGHAVFHGTDVDQRLVLVDLVERGSKGSCLLARVLRSAQDNRELKHRQQG